ncbi:MAG TPA: HAMP domain-containing histidine kinase [Candidatus Butyricicoccus stercorigallinarum]|nr:HAMP domain-containing histidine kinase [Candidatus Butyricicoccus stercorigallinarum]
MRNLFVKNYVAFALLILVSFTFAGGVFMAQVSRYSVKEKQEQLETTVGYVDAIVEDNTVLLQMQDNTFLKTYLDQQAAVSGCAILLTDAQGNVRISSLPQGDGLEQDQIQGTVSGKLVQSIQENGTYFGLGNVSGLFSENYFIAGASCVDESGQTVAVVIAAVPSASTTGLMHTIMRSYLFIVAITLMLTLIISWFVSDMLTRPLKSLVSAAKKFGHGEFDVRVSENNNCDEIDELAVSFNNMATSLQQQEELSRGFVANVSHELKTPMTSIRGFVDGMLDGTIPQERHPQYLHIISEEVNRLSRLVIRMLDAAKIQAGELIITPAPFDLTEMAARVLISFEKQINDKGLEMDVDLQDSLIVNGDSDHIYRVIYNLVDNAVKFVDVGGTLTIRAEAEGAMSLFSIRNTGTGIPAEDLPHVFDRFYKVDRSRSRDRTGAGLGLYIVKSIVNLHGGDISVRSADGETEFAFTVPLAQKASGGSEGRQLTQK